MESEKGTVCVTGGTGYIGSWLILRLLDHGYSVRTTIRSNSEHKKDLGFLTSLPGASEKLKIFDADLNDPESFRAAIEGCIGVFHVATPVDFFGKDTEEVVIKRSSEGATGILKACLENSKTVKKLVYTSSASAVGLNGNNSDELDESVWSDIDYVKSLRSPGLSYAISKTLTERAVLEFSEKHGFEVVTLVPSIVVGPFICPKFAGSVQFTLGLLSGKMKNVESSSLASIDMVHVDDVARAHIFLFEHPEAKGRYNCSSNAITVESASHLLCSKYPELQAHRKDSEKDQTKSLKLLPSLSSKKLLDLGFKFKYGVEEMLDDAVKCSKEKGYL
ncbi:vestitone reductase isoform X1 [Morus notabilis]|uniref:vestitone reductase isoform X1 n=1 Tax=Morus notabilis TaxID=981085 RepID=UPI000CED7722|nr:vestitone reductase isoform X1 [Morus notabilis]